MATHPGLEGHIENDRRGPLRLILELDAAASGAVEPRSIKVSRYG